MNIPKTTKLYQLKPSFAQKNRLPIYFVAVPTRETEKAVLLHGHGTTETTKLGVCMQCGRVLTHPVSVELGIGPECGKHHYDWDSIGGYTKENLARLKTEIANIAVNNWVPKSCIIEIHDTTEQVQAPETKTVPTKDAPIEELKQVKFAKNKKGDIVLKIVSPYDLELITKIKTLPGRLFQNEGGQKYWIASLAVPSIDLLSEWGFTLSDKVKDWYNEATTKKEINITGLGGTLYPFQKDAVEFVERMNGRALIADPPGVGKTVEALGYIQLHPELRPVVIICPANAKMVWKRHVPAWLSGNPTVHVLSGRPNGTLPELKGNDIIIINYDIIASQLSANTKGQKEVEKQAKKKLTSDQWKVFQNIKNNWDKLVLGKDNKFYLMGVNSTEWEQWNMGPTFNELVEKWFSVLDKTEIPGWVDWLKSINPQIVVLDESTRIKNKKAARTKAILELCKNVPHIIPMSGTPIERHPSEFYTTLQMLRPDLFGNWKWYASRFCDLKETRWGIDWSGATNTEELYQLISGTLMIRRNKADLLPDLPPKQRVIVPLDVDLTNYRKAERDIITWIERNKGEAAAVKAEQAEHLVKLNVLRQLAIDAKIDSCISWIEEFLESDEKLVVFAYHRKVVEKIYNHFKKQAVMIQGGTSDKDREKAVDSFQNDPNTKLFVGNLIAASEAITLTAASNTVTLEFTEKPSVHFQAEDRVYRQSQLSDSVNAYYLIACDTIEEDLANILNKREKIIAEVLDGRKVDDDSTGNMFTDLYNILRKKEK